MGQEGIWDAIEKFWIESNPMFMCRLKAIDLNPEKGEETSDYYNRLKVQFEESEMDKASWSVNWSTPSQSLDMMW